MKAIVTGATGFIGTWLVRELLEKGYDVFALIRDRNRVPILWRNRVHIIEKDFKNMKESEKKDLTGADYFFHLAWTGTSGILRSYTDMQLKNVQYACEALEFADEIGCRRFINAGSIMEYEMICHIKENDKLIGLGNIYSIAKLTADVMLKTLATQKKIEYINVVISNIYGVGEKSERFLNNTLKKMIQNENIPLTHGKQLYDFIYVTDAVKEIILVAEKEEEMQNYYIGNRNLRPLKEFVIEMKEVLNSKSDLEFGKIPFNGRELDYSNINMQWFEKWNYIPEVSFKEGILLTQNWIMRGGE